MTMRVAGVALALLVVCAVVQYGNPFLADVVKYAKLLETAKGIISATTGDRGSIVLEGRRLRYTVEGYVGRWKWKYRGKAWDEQTGIKVTSSGWKSRGGAREHALEDLVKKLVEQGVLKEAPPRNEL